MYFALSVATGFQCENGCAAREAGGGGGGLVDQKSERLRKKYWNSIFMKKFTSWILKVVDLEKNNAKT